MTFKLFFNYRINAFVSQLKVALEQFSQLGIIIAAFMYTALPGVFLGIFMAIGFIVTQKSQYTVLIAFSLLLIQSVIVQTFAYAIKDSPHRLFQRSLVSSKWPLFLADHIILLMSNMTLMASLIVAISMGLNKLSQAPQFVIFMLILWGLPIAVLYQPRRLLLYVCTLLATLWFAPNWSNSALYALWLLLIPLCFFNIIPPFRTRKHLVGALHFWLVLHYQRRGEIEWRLYLGFIFYLLVLVLLEQRPDLNFFMGLVSGCIYLLLVSSLQLAQNEKVTTYGMWFNTHQQRKRYYAYQYIAPCMLSIIAIIMISLNYFDWVFMSTLMIGFPLCMYFARKKPTQFALAWFIIAGSFCFVNYAAFSLL